MNDISFIDLVASASVIKDELQKRTSRIIDRAQFIMGDDVTELESVLANYVSVNSCVSCANGTDALQLALMALEISPGDHVVTPVWSFFATAEAVSILGAIPDFVDVDARTFNISPVALKEHIDTCVEKNKPLPKAVITVDLFGLPADYIQIEKICGEYSIPIIEDSAQGFGGMIHDRKAGSFGTIATTSFFPAKPLGCFGDGGALFTNNSDLADRIRSLRVHGKGKDKYDNVRIGMNSRLDTIQAAVLLEKFKIFESELSGKKNLAEYYSNNINGKLATPIIADGYLSSWAQYSVLLSNHEVRDALQKHLKNLGIPTQVYYRTPFHLLKVYSDFNYRKGDFPVAESLSEKVLSLPMHAYLSNTQKDYIVTGINEFFR